MIRTSNLSDVQEKLQEKERVITKAGYYIGLLTVVCTAILIPIATICISWALIKWAFL